MFAGQRSEVIDTIHITVENNNSSRVHMNTILDMVVEATRSELAAVSENLTAAGRGPAGALRP